MFMFMLGLLCGWMVTRFTKPLFDLFRRTEQKIEAELNSLNK